MRATCLSSPIPTTRASAWWPVAIRSWRPYACTNGKTCYRPPRKIWRRCAPWCNPVACAARTRSVCVSARWSISTRSPSTSRWISRISLLASSARQRASSVSPFFSHNDRKLMKLRHKQGTCNEIGAFNQVQ